MPQATSFSEFMSIKKITSAQEFAKVCEDLSELMSEDNEKHQHWFGPISKQSMINSWGNPSLLTHSMHTWANFENGKADAIIMFFDSINTKCGKRMWSEFFWTSKNPKASFSLLRTALDFARSKGIEFISISSYENHPKASRLREIYKKMGFKKDSETYIKKL